MNESMTVEQQELRLPVDPQLRCHIVFAVSVSLALPAAFAVMRRLSVPLFAIIDRAANTTRLVCRFRHFNGFIRW